jgi:hypothetical protein
MSWAFLCGSLQLYVAQRSDKTFQSQNLMMTLMQVGKLSTRASELTQDSMPGSPEAQIGFSQLASISEFESTCKIELEYVRAEVAAITEMINGVQQQIKEAQKSFGGSQLS